MSETKRNPFVRQRETMKIWPRLLAFGLAFIMSACVIVEIVQEESVSAGSVTTVTLTVQEPEAETQNDHKGVITILVPEDWSFVGGDYDASDDNGAVGAGDLVESPAWADSAELLIPAPEGMKWVGAISDTGYVHAPNLTVETNVMLQVGETVGEYGLGYVVTKEAFATKDWFGGDYPGADSTMNQAITVTEATAIEDVIVDGVPARFALDQNYPNPFNPSTKIRYALDEPSEVRLSIFDVSGRVIEVLDAGSRAAGIYEATFDAGDLPSGTYLYRLEAGDFVETRSMVLMK
jgi:hypothetical protein